MPILPIADLSRFPVLIAHSPRDDPLGDHSLLLIDHEPGVARVSDDLIEGLEKGFSV